MGKKSAISKHVECFNHRYQSAKIAENSTITNTVKCFYINTNCHRLLVNICVLHFT